MQIYNDRTAGRSAKSWRAETVFQPSPFLPGISKILRLRNTSSLHQIKITPKRKQAEWPRWSSPYRPRWFLRKGPQRYRPVRPGRNATGCTGRPPVRLSQAQADNPGKSSLRSLRSPRSLRRRRTFARPWRCQFSAGLRQRRKSPSGAIDQRDYQHGRVEMYDQPGRHDSEFDPNTGAGTKPANPRYKVEP